jgi:hypothetical protein
VYENHDNDLSVETSWIANKNINLTELQWMVILDHKNSFHHPI